MLCCVCDVEIAVDVLQALQQIKRGKGETPAAAPAAAAAAAVTPAPVAVVPLAASIAAPAPARAASPPAVTIKSEPAEEDEPRVQAGGQSVRLSQVTPDVEAAMSAEEYEVRDHMFVVGEISLMEV
jgi:hypothetical protein